MAEREVRTAPILRGRALGLAYAVVGWIPFMCVREVLHTEQPIDEVVQLLSVAAMAVFVLGWLTYSWLEFRCYGVSVLRVLTCPIAAGGDLEVEIDCRLPLDSQAPILARLKRQIPLGKTQRLQWQAETKIDPGSLRIDGERVVIPLRF